RRGKRMTQVDPLSAAILELLADAPPPGGVSLPRIGKRLQVSASVLLRHLTLMGDAQIGGQAGPGWVRVTQTEERWVVFLTDEGRATLTALRKADAGSTWPAGRYTDRCFTRSSAALASPSVAARTGRRR